MDDMFDFNSLPTPYYIVYEDALRRNLSLISDVAHRSGADIIMAFKANALWRTFDIFREYGVRCTASSLNELKLGRDFLCERVHSYCPAYTCDNITAFLEGSSHITFNSVSQYRRFAADVARYNSNVDDVHRCSPGLRVNPKCSVIETDIYNPALPGSRFGASASELQSGLPDGVEGLHFHALCESSAEDLQVVMNAFVEQFGHLLPDVRWLNMGGGHLMTRKGYNIDLLVSLICGLRSRFPHLQIILEPGSAFTWQTGDLVTRVVDVVCNDNVRTAIIDASFACHMPDTLEMPYRPDIAESVPDDTPGAFAYRLGGNSCLSGDFCGPWVFDAELKPGQLLTLRDMNHYTTVKTTMFNGISHPDIYLLKSDRSVRLLRHYSYEDYRDRMS